MSNNIYKKSFLIRTLFAGLGNWAFKFAFFFACLFSQNGWGQVGGANATYSYVSTQTTSTYTSITGGTQHYATTAVATDGVTAAVNIGFNFTFNHRVYSQVYISNNGFVTFGSTTAASNYTPLSNTLVSAVFTYEGAISGMGSDLVNSTATGASAEVRSQLTGTAPNRIFIIQYKDVKLTGGSANQRLSFQIQLKENGNVIDIVYGPNNASGTVTWTGQVGVRGSSQSDYSNRTGTNWTSATLGTLNTSTMTIGTTGGTTIPAVNLCYRFTPPAAMSAPTHATLPYTENFNVDPWSAGTWLQSLPSTASVRTWPGRGDNSWRRDNVTAANSGWTGITGGYTVAAPAASGTARFHSFDTRAGIKGNMDFYLNFSTVGTKVLTFDYLNTVGTDNLVVQLSTDGGATFGAALTTLTTSTAWTTQTINLGSSTSTTCVVRFVATSDWGSGAADLGVDNVSITIPTPTCATTPSPSNAATGVAQLPTLSWAAVSGATGYDVYLGTTSGSLSLVSTNQAGTSYSPASLNASTLYYWRVVPVNTYGNRASGCSEWSFTTSAPTPTISVGTLTAFGNQCVSTTSAAGSFTVSGINLTANVDIAALSGYSYSLTAGGTYTTTLSIPASGTLASTLVYVKFNPTAAITYNGNIVVSSTGAPSQNVAATGTGVNTTISTQPSSAAATYCTNGTAAALTVAVTAASGSAFSYQWYSNTIASTSGGTAVGTNAASYTPLTTTNGTLYYYCVVSGCGTAATSTVSGAITTGACINMSNGSTTLSGNANFYDSGGPGASYGNNESFTYTVFPASCNNVRVTFSSFSTESLTDFLYVYNGNSIAAPQVAGSPFSGASVPAAITSSAADGSLTFRFTSDISIVGNWVATLSNIPVSTGPAAPTGFAGLLNPEVGSTQTYSVTNVSGVTYAWSFPSGWVINSGQGTNSVTVTVGGTNGNISVTPTRCSLPGTAYTVATTIPNYRWKYISSNLGAATWTGGEARNISITIQNTGVATWNSTYTNNIGVRWNSTTGSLSGTPWADYFVRTSVGSLAPAATGTFTLAIEAKNATAGPVYGSNLADGTYYLAFDMVSEGQCWFATNTGTCGPGNSVFYSAVQTISTIPTITCTALTAFGNVCTNATTTNTFTVSGVNLTNDVTINALTGYTYSTTINGTYTSTLTLTPSAGSLNQTVFVKFTPTAAQAYSGNITVSSSGAVSQNVSVSGTGIAAPTVNAGSDFILCSGQNIAMNASTNAVGLTTPATANSGTVTISGTDNTNPTATYTFTGLPAGALITGITVNISSAGGVNCPSWYSVTTRLNGVQQGVAGCATNTTYTNLNGQAANGLVVAVRGQDNDAFGDLMTITYTVSLNYTYVINPTYAWSPATGLSATNVLNPICSTTSNQTYTLTVTGTNGCSASDAVVVTTSSSPASPTVSASTTTLNVGGSTTITATAAGGGTLRWYDAPTGGTLLLTGSDWNTGVLCVANNTQTRYVEEFNGSCGSAVRTAVSVTTRPLIASNPSNGIICSAGGSVTLSANITNPTAYSWSPGATLSSTTAAIVTATPTVTTQYTLVASATGCASITGTNIFNVGVIEGVSFTPTSSPLQVCEGDIAVLSSNLNSSNFSVSNAPSFSPRTAPGSGVTILVNGATSSAATLSGGDYDDGGWGGIPIGFTYNFFGQNFTSLAVGTNGLVMFGTVPGYTSAAGNLGQYSFNTTGGAFPNANNPGNIIALLAHDINMNNFNTSTIVRYWTEGIAPTRKFVLDFVSVPTFATPSTFSTAQLVLNETTGIVEIYVTSAPAGTGNSAKIIGLQDAAKTIGAVAGPNNTTPEWNYRTTAATNLGYRFIPGANYSFQWSTGGSPISGATSTTYTTAALNIPGTVTYVCAATNPNTYCASQATVNVPVNAKPAAPLSGGNVTACSNDGAQSLTMTSPVGTTVNWYSAPTGGTLLLAGSNTYTTASAGTYYADVVVTASGCRSTSRTAVTLTVNLSPAQPTATTAISYCQGAASTALTATATSGNSLRWHTVATGGTPSTTAPTPSTSTSGTQNYWVSQVSGTNGCESTRLQIIVTINTVPAVPAVTTPVTYCQNATAVQLTATITSPNTANWYTVPTGGTPSGTAPTPSTASAGTVNYYVSQTNSFSCESSRSLIAVVVNPTLVPTVNNSASSTSACSGGAITFTATPVNGGTTPTYQWYYNGALQSGQTASTFVLSTPLANDQIYVTMVSNATPCLSTTSAVSSNTVTLTSTASTPAVSISASTSTTICPATTVNFSVSSSSNMGASPTYQWRLNGTNISGATSSTYTTSSLLNSDQISLVMTSSLPGLCLTNNPATSNNISFTVTPATSITTEPISASACLGTSQSFTVVAVGTGTLTYQWRKNGVNITGNASAQTATLTLSGITSGDADNYSVLVTGSCGTATSNTVTLSISPATVISTQPLTQTSCAGSNVTFSVTATGSGTISYQWRKNGTAISGATSASYAINNISASDAANYSVLVTAGCGALTSSNALLTVNAATVITTQPTALTVCQGSVANFAVAGTGTGTLTYQWLFNGSPISGATSSTYSDNNAQLADAGNYSVIITGSCGAITSNSVALVVNATTSISTQPTNRQECVGQPATFSVTAAGTAPFSYQWRFNGSPISGATASTYTIPSPTIGNEGTYQVVVTGACGTVNSNSVVLTVFPTLTAGSVSTSQSICSNAAPAAFTSTTAAGGGTGTYSYQWQSSPNGSSSWTDISGATLATYSSGALTSTTFFRRNVTSGNCSSVSSNTITVTVSPPPSAPTLNQVVDPN
jgi:hypothetical protein